MGTKDKTYHLLPRPKYDPEMRKAMNEAVTARFITSRERKGRVLTAMQMRGIKTLTDLSHIMGVEQPWLHKILRSEQPTLLGVQRLAVALNVSVSYLTEREVADG